MRFVEVDAQLRRVVSVVKMGTAHSKSRAGAAKVRP
jgi:hypothetical protein